jgi:hypothetical protein
MCSANVRGSATPRSGPKTAPLAIPLFAIYSRPDLFLSAWSYPWSSARRPYRTGKWLIVIDKSSHLNRRRISATLTADPPTIIQVMLNCRSLLPLVSYIFILTISYIYQHVRRS